MDRGNSSKDENPPVKIEEEEKEEEQAGPSNPKDDSKTMQPVESTITLKDDDSAIEAIRRYMAEKLGFSEGKKVEESKKKVLDEVSVAGVVKYIQSGQCRKIIVMAGAGISTSAGIPDFRSPGSGLYDNLKKYKLPHPQRHRLLRFVIKSNYDFTFNDVKGLSGVNQSQKRKFGFSGIMKSVVLPSGQHMPIIGLGTWQAKPEVVEQAVLWALETGYRLIDTAFNYGNEEAIGKAIQTWISQGKKREELFITTKLPNFANRPSDVSIYLNESLKRLRLQYLDLYLIHHPFGFFEPPSGVSPPKIDMETDHLAVWKEMENAVHSGLVRNIGLSNFNKKQIERICKNAEIQPANLQIELHAFLQQPDLVDACRKMNISVTAYAPLGSPSAKTHFKNKYDFQPNDVPDCLTEPLVLEISEKFQKTPAQILLRFFTQMGIVVVPKSSSKDRIRENFEALSFDLEEEDMKRLRSLDRGENGRLFDFLFYKGVESHPEYPFEKKFAS